MAKSMRQGHSICYDDQETGEVAQIEENPVDDTLGRTVNSVTCCIKEAFVIQKPLGANEHRLFSLQNSICKFF